jgi:hypothetical protein
MYTFGLSEDLLVQKMQEGQKAHMPGVGTPTALSLIGDDRNILRGFAETDDAYALRLKKAFETWQHAGSAESVMWSILGYVSPFSPKMETVSNSANWDILPPGSGLGTQPAHWSTFTAMPQNWNWDGVNFIMDNSLWWRAWVIIGPGVWAKNDTWGTAGRKWGDRNGTWGSTATRAQVTAVQQLVDTWKAAQCYVPWIIILRDVTYLDAFLPAGDAKLPDGLYGQWHKVVGGVAVASRTNKAIYWDGPKP